jgi:hypothetical protein
MWDPLRKLFAQFKTLQAKLGTVAFKTRPINDVTSRAALQLRVTKGQDDNLFYIGLMIFSIKIDLGVRNDVFFDIESAKQIRADLDSCIAECQRLRDLEGQHSD